MVDVPERIWIEHGEDCPYFYEEDELHEVGQVVIEYTRSDLIAELAAQLAEVEKALVVAQANLNNIEFLTVDGFLEWQAARRALGGKKNG